MFLLFFVQAQEEFRAQVCFGKGGGVDWRRGVCHGFRKHFTAVGTPRRVTSKGVMAAWAGPCAVRAVAKLCWSAGACVFEFFFYMIIIIFAFLVLLFLFRPMSIIIIIMIIIIIIKSNFT